MRTENTPRETYGEVYKAIIPSGVTLPEFERLIATACPDSENMTFRNLNDDFFAYGKKARNKFKGEDIFFSQSKVFDVEKTFSTFVVGLLLWDKLGLLEVDRSLNWSPGVMPSKKFAEYFSPE